MPHSRGTRLNTQSMGELLPVGIRGAKLNVSNAEDPDLSGYQRPRIRVRGESALAPRRPYPNNGALDKQGASQRICLQVGDGSLTSPKPRFEYGYVQVNRADSFR